MTKSLRELARDEREQLEEPEAWIAWVRLAAVPFAVLEVAIERGNYPRDHETWAWTLTAIFAAGAAALFVAARRRGVRDTASGSRRAPLAGAAALVFDTTVVSGYTVLYAFEPGSPVRQLLLLVVIEAALRYGRRGAVWALASAPGLALFEWRASERLDVPYDPGHVLFPIGLQILVGLIVGALSERRARER